MIAHIEGWFHSLRRRLSRSEWTIRALKLERASEPDHKPGLIMIQIDGLAYKQFQRALMEGSMPFLKRLLNKQNYRLHHHYSGVPSTTPAVQGELFYGVRQAVPAFSFRDHDTGEIVKMYEHDPAEKVQARLSVQGAGILEGGSCYSNIYTGGAKESHFCPVTWGWGNLFDAINPFILAGLIAAHAWSLIRVVTLFGVEYILAMVDLVRGIIAGHDFFKELKFVPTRVLISVTLRELLVIGALTDIARGLPVIHFNLLAYDEQAHRRGPSSAFAHWTLKGIDDAIKRVWSASQRSSLRDYQLWVYSDHGQEDTIPYPDENGGKTVQEAIAEIFGEEYHRGLLNSVEESGIQSQRVRWVGGKRIRKKYVVPVPKATQEETPPQVVVTAMGPVGHIYPPMELDAPSIERFAHLLVHQAKIPIVLVPDREDCAWAWTSKGRFHLPEEASAILGSDHPFLLEVAADLVKLCHHPDAGRILFSGWRFEGKPMTFPVENGSHAGPGSHETHAFALLPSDAPLRPNGKDYLRPENLHEAALNALGRSEAKFYITAPRKSEETKLLRVMTYNVHSCVGMDRRVSMARIARVIMQADPDVVALQELDVGRPRTGGHDQAHEIARHLEMDFHFHPAIHLEEERYGDAVLSRLPMKLIKTGPLPGLHHRPKLEPRGAIWVELEHEGLKFNLINTHLGLRVQERKAQAEALVGPEWLESGASEKPTLLVGDFNSMPSMDAYKRIMASGLRDAQVEAEGHRPRGTWFGRVPVGRIDHIFATPDVRVHGIEIVRTDLAKMASDHLPLIATLEIVKR